MRTPSILARSQDWPERLAAFIDARRYTPFAWGTNDCAMLAADAVLELTGMDPAAQYRGAYATEDQADGMISAAGGLEALSDSLAAAAGLGSCMPAFAQRGDLVLVEHGNIRALGVVTGDAVAVPGPDGLAFLPVRAAVRAWSV
ncbi:DUF6950 family protein [Rhodovarius lipocyclicus]|uniref:DUF6950 family protein n=1 Tax=Rhodovarius lipocyclicus TaxID=268410 RepID=UPI00135A6B81|nr:hypothetical protein [Rhodovarius lipocyclicus]